MMKPVKIIKTNISGGHFKKLRLNYFINIHHYF